MIERVILITGANGGLGLGIASEFIEEASTNFVWLGVRTGRKAAQQLVETNANQAELIDLDVTKPEAWNDAVAKILVRHKRLDVLVNNAGTHEDALLGTMPKESWSRVLSAHLDGTFHGCQAVLPAMISQRHGRIINMSSLSAFLAPAGQTNYAAAKAGVIALTQSLAKEVARIGITVNAVCPGYIETAALDPLDPQQKQAALARIPMRRFGTAREVAAAVRFLACPQASYITGSVLKVDGGIL